MYHKHHTKGIIISSKIEGDHSRRVNIFTEHFGLIIVRVQGTRHLQSKLRANSQDFSFGEFSLVHGKSGWKMVSAKSHKNYFEIFRSSPPKLKIVCNILNLIKKLVSEEARQNDEVGQEAGGSLFATVTNFFDFLATAKAEDIVLSECLTLLRILHILGYMRHDPDFSIPIASSEINVKDLEIIAPKRAQIIRLINESLQAA